MRPGDALLEVLAQLSQMSPPVRKGDVEGHPFRGNQYTDGQGAGVETGKPVTLYFSRNTTGLVNTTGADYGQDIEPAGEYMVVDHEPLSAVNGRVTGKIHFEKPLVLEHGDSSSKGWKKTLSEKFGGKTGKALSRAVRAAGYDGILTYDKYGLSEAVNLAGAKSPMGKGDSPGHEFRGNQYTNGQGTSGKDSGPRGSKTFHDERGGAPPKVGDYFIVYRLGSKEGTTIEGKNAGNADGTASHIARIDDYERPQFDSGSGDTLHAFRVKLEEPFTAYTPIVNNSKSGTKVGRQEQNGVIAYSFARGGRGYTFEHLKSIPLARVKKELLRIDRSYTDFDMSGTRAGAQAIRNAFGHGG